MTEVLNNISAIWMMSVGFIGMIITLALNIVKTREHSEEIKILKELEMKTIKQDITDLRVCIAKIEEWKEGSYRNFDEIKEMIRDLKND